MPGPDNDPRNESKKKRFMRASGLDLLRRDALARLQGDRGIVPEILARLRANPWHKLLALLLAVLSWLYVQGEEIREERVKAQVAWTLPEGLVATEPLPVTAFLSVRGSRTAINRAHAAPIRMVVDVADLSEGEHTVELAGVVPEGLPPSLEQLGVTPSAVHFRLDEVATHHVQIHPVLVGEPADGFVVSSVELEPSVVPLRGPREAVSALREVSTRPIDVSGLSESGSREVLLDLPRSVEVAQGLPIQARLTVIAQTQQRRLEEVPVYVWQKEPGEREMLVVEPSRVAVLLEGPTEALRDLRADEVVAMVRLTGPVTGEQPVEVWYGRKDGARVEVLDPDDKIEAIDMFPPSVTVSPAKP